VAIVRARYVRSQQSAARWYGIEWVCGWNATQQVVPMDEMVDRIRSAIIGRTDPGFFIIARTDALAMEGLESAVRRAKAYVDAGADGIFAEAVTELSQYEAFRRMLPAHVPRTCAAGPADDQGS
jgi:2-methylisocitrate lyase-like PEP mutase family enzyme